MLAGHLFRRVSKKRWKKNWFALYANKLEWFKSKNHVLLGSVGKRLFIWHYPDLQVVERVELLCYAAITEEHYCSDYSTSNNTGKGGVRPFGESSCEISDALGLDELTSHSKGLCCPTSKIQSTLQLRREI